MADSSAPYILSLLVAGFGWLINTSVTEIKALNLIEYQTSRVESDYQGSTQAYVNIDIFNRSHSASLRAGQFLFICGATDPESCFGRSSGAADRPPDSDLITFQPLAGVGIKSRTSVDGGVSQLVGEARIMPQSSVRYRVMLTKPEQEFLVLLDYPVASESLPAFQFRLGGSFEGWILRNYLNILFTGFVVTAIMLVGWFLPVLYARWRPSPPPTKQPEKIDVSISYT